MIKKTKMAKATKATAKCTQCKTKKREELAAEDFSLAVLVSLMPLIVFTLFGQMGLF